MTGTEWPVRRNPIRWPCLLAFGLLAPGNAPAQSYPQRPVRIVVPFPGGSGADIIARIYTPKLAELTGQQFIVDNRAGAAGNVGAEAVVRSAPDGYTLLVAPASLASGQSLTPPPGFDLGKDLEHAAMLASLPMALVGNPSLPANSLKEFVALAVAQPGKVTYGSSGVGSSGHLSAELFQAAADIRLVHVPYKGGQSLITDLMGGQIATVVTSIATVLPNIRSGRIRALAITSPRRSQIAPDIPTVSESGYPGFNADTWHALSAPARTAPAIIAQLNKLVVVIGQDNDARGRLQGQGAEARADTPAQTREFIAAEIRKWGRVIKAAGIQGE